MIVIYFCFCHRHRGYDDDRRQSLGIVISSCDEWEGANAILYAMSEENSKFLAGKSEQVIKSRSIDSPFDFSSGADEVNYEIADELNNEILGEIDNEIANEIDTTKNSGDAGQVDDTGFTEVDLHQQQSSLDYNETQPTNVQNDISTDGLYNSTKL